MLNNTPKSAVKSLNNDNLDINASIHDVKFLVDRYMTRSFTLGVTAPAGLLYFVNVTREPPVTWLTKRSLNRFHSLNSIRKSFRRMS